MNTSNTGKLFDKAFTAFSPEEAKQNFEWFVNRIPQVITELTAEVKKHPDFTLWEPDFSIRSINEISEWVSKIAYFVEIPLQEIEEMISAHNYPLHIAESLRNNRNRFTPELNTICQNIGVYIGEALRNNLPNLKWICKKKPKTDIYINQPVLTNKQSTPEYPAYLIITNVIFNMVEGKYGEHGVTEIYERWYKLFGEGPEFLKQELLDKTPDSLKKIVTETFKNNSDKK